MRRFTDETGPLGHYSTRRIRLRPVDHDGRMEPSLSTEFRLAVPKCWWARPTVAGQRRLRTGFPEVRADLLLGRHSHAGRRSSKRSAQSHGVSLDS